MEHQEFDLKFFLKLVKTNRRLLFIFPIIALMICIFINNYVLKPTYQATTTLIVQKNKEVENEYNNFLANKELIKTYSQIGKSDNFLEKVKKRTDSSLSIEDLAKKVQINTNGDSQLIFLQVEDVNPVKAAKISNLASTIFIDEVNQITNLENLKIAYQAIAPDKPIKPRKLLNIAFAAIIGIGLALAIIFLRDYLNNTYKDPQELEENLKLPILGIIPVIKNEKVIRLRIKSERGIINNEYSR